MYMLSHWNGQQELKKKMFEILSLAGTQEGQSTELVRDYEGQVMPLISCQWLAGEQTAKTILTDVSSIIEELDLAYYFASKREKNLITNTFRLMFTPTIFAKSFSPINQAVKLFKKCAQSYDEKGQPNIMMIGSNWDPESFESLYINPLFDTIFDYVKPEHITLSGYIHINKPKRAFFEHILKQHKLDPADCIFIDDQEENVKAARTAGMTALHLNNKNYKEIKQELVKLGALPSTKSKHRIPKLH